MLSYYTNGINDPWTLKDIEDYERNGSQRDKVIYNSFYNSRLILTDENIYFRQDKKFVLYNVLCPPIGFFER